MIVKYTPQELEKIKQVMSKAPVIIGQVDFSLEKKSEKPLEFKKISQYGNVVKFNANQQIFKEGDPGGCIYVVLSGSVSIVDDWDDELYTLEVGDILGEMDIASASTRHFSTIAKTDASLFMISEEKLSDVIVAMPSIALKIINTLSNRCRKLMGIATENT